MEEVLLKAKRRTIIGKQVGSLRQAGELPGVLYGSGVEATPISLDLKETTRLLTGLSGSALVIIELDGERHTALVRERQRHILLGTLRHVDFQAVSMLKKLRVAVPVILTGESPATKEQIGIITTGMEMLNVESLPGDLPENITIDISELKEVGDAIYLKDIDFPPNVTILADHEEMLVMVAPLEAEEIEEVEEELVEEDEIGEPEVIERGKREEDEDEEKDEE
jgi:large subunit ribosomal protein L25